MKKENITIAAIHRVFRLLSQVYNSNTVYLFDVAKEMGCKKTDLMEYVTTHSGLFSILSEKKGCAIKGVYLTVSDNPYHPENLKMLKERNERTLYVTQWEYYGQKECYYLYDDREKRYDYKDGYNWPYARQTWLWRNTKEKLESLKKGRHYHMGCGSTGTFSGTDIPFAVSVSEMRNLLADGWKLTGELPKVILEANGYE